MQTRNRTDVRQRLPSPRAVLCWGALAFVAVQAAYPVVAGLSHLPPRHPEYARKLALLRQQAAEHRGEPLLLALGTSRMAFGFCASADRKARSWQFNFGLTGIGPVRELVCFRRLLDAGIRPARLFIEIHPAFLHQTPDWCESRAVDVRQIGWRDLLVMRRLAYQPAELTWRWTMSRLSPWHAHRSEVVRRFAWSWRDHADRREERTLVETDAFGWSRYPVRPADEADRRRLGRLCADLYALPLDRFRVSDVPRRAIDELLELCRARQIAAAVVFMPEGESFRRGYTPEAVSRLDEYVDQLRRKHSIEVFDCRAWCDDHQFCDGQHLLPEGAAAFTARLRGERLSPWLADVKRTSPDAPVSRIGRAGSPASAVRRR